MIYFLNASGGVAHCLPESVYQGSAEGNTLYLVSPHAASAEVSAAFRLPDGSVTPRFRLEYAGLLRGYTGEGGRTASGWSLSLPASVTAQYGTVRVQFYFLSAGQGQEASASAQFTVERGVPSQLPSAPEADAYEDIVAALTALRADLINGYYPARAAVAWNDGHVYGANELVFCPEAGEYGAIVRSKTADNAQPPFTDGVLNAQDWEIAVSFDTIADDFFGDVQAAKTAAENARAAAEAAQAAAETAEGNAQTSQTAAQGYAAAAQESAGNAATAAGQAEEFAAAASQASSSAEAAASQAGQSAAAAESAAQSAYASADAAREIAEELELTDYAKVDGSYPGLTAGKVAHPLTVTVDGLPVAYDGSAARDISINTTSSTDTEAVHFTAQTLTDEQKAQARANVGAAGTSGEYPGMAVGKAAELVGYASVGSTATANENWYEIADVSVNAAGNDGFSLILLLNGRTIAAQYSGAVELEGRCTPGAWTYTNLKILFGNLPPEHIRYCTDADGRIRVFLYAPSTVYTLSVLSWQKGTALAAAFPNTLLQASALPEGLSNAVNANSAANDANGNPYLKTYTNVSQLGLSYPCTAVQILNALPPLSFFFANVESRASTITDVPADHGVLLVYKGDNNRVEVTFQRALSADHRQYEGIWTWNSSQFTSIAWQEFAYLLDVTSPQLSDLSWADIKLLSGENLLSLLTLGDSKTFSMGGNTFTAKLVDTQYNGQAGAVFFCTTEAAVNYTVWSAEPPDTTGGWAAAPLRSTLNDTLFNTIEEGLRGVIKTVPVKYGGGGASAAGQSEVSAVDCKLFLPSVSELQGNCRVDVSGYVCPGDGSDGRWNLGAKEGAQLQYFAAEPGAVLTGYLYNTRTCVHAQQYIACCNTSLLTGNNGLTAYATRRWATTLGRLVFLFVI